MKEEFNNNTFFLKRFFLKTIKLLTGNDSILFNDNVNENFEKF